MATTEHHQTSASGEVPRVGEEIHLPGPSIVPLILTVGLTFAIVGITTSFVLVVVGGIVSLVSVIVWIASAKRDYDELPLEHHH